MTAMLLTVDDLHTYFGDSHILQGVSLVVAPGQAVALLGRNGAGKTTTLRSITRMVVPRRGRVVFDGRPLERLTTYQIARAGLAFVQETRAVFPSLSVEENLSIAIRSAAAPGGWSLERVFESFPALRERRRIGGTQLSGGEQQMLAIARALLGNPRLLLLDEPSEGLAPRIVQQIATLLQSLKAEGMAMVLVEQNFALATAVADQVVVLGKGRVRWSGSSAELRESADIRQTWLGV
jgi:branched-chain amino acid transport system ATP-binding protein